MSAVAAICALPRTFHAGGGSPLSIVMASGYREDPKALSHAAVAAHLRAHPDLVEDWLGWSLDQRSAPAWVFEHDGHRGRVWRYPGGPSLAFDNPFDACAAFILRHVADYSPR